MAARSNGGGGERQRDLEAGISWVYILSPSQSVDKSPTTWVTAPGTHQTAQAHSHTPTRGEEGQRELSSSIPNMTTVITPPNLKEINILPDKELVGKN